MLHDDDSHKEGALVRSYAQQRDDAQHLAREIAAEKDAADAMDGCVRGMWGSMGRIGMAFGGVGSALERRNATTEVSTQVSE